jgi:hypothetical protein
MCLFGRVRAVLSLTIPWLFLTVLSLGGCEREAEKSAQTTALKATVTPAQSAQPSADDVRIGREVMPLTEVLAQLKAGVPKLKVLENVRRRHIATMIVEANELEFAANGAGRDLIAALRDPGNLPTPAQEAIYMQLVAEQQRATTASKRGITQAPAVDNGDATSPAPFRLAISLPYAPGVLLIVAVGVALQS